MGVDSLPKTVTRQRRDGDMNPGPSAPESSTLTARLPNGVVCCRNNIACLLSVFPRAYVRNYTPIFAKYVCMLPIRPWLGPPLASLRYFAQIQETYTTSGFPGSFNTGNQYRTFHTS